MHVEVTQVVGLRFDDGTPVRAASAVAAFGDGWLIAQDDTTHAAWHRSTGTRPLRLLPPVEGHDTFTERAGTKHLKPDLEAACGVTVAGTAGVLLLGSGSTSRRTQAVLVLDHRRPRTLVADLAPLYATVAQTLGVEREQLNLEGACPVGRRLRWFQRANARTGVPSASVEVDLDELIEAVTGRRRPQDVAVGGCTRYDLGPSGPVALAVTDAAALRDGRIVLSTAAEDTANPVDDGPVVAAALALLEGLEVTAVAAVTLDGTAPKIEGLAAAGRRPDGSVRLIAVVDADDPGVASLRLDLLVRW